MSIIISIKCTWLPSSYPTTVKVDSTRLDNDFVIEFNDIPTTSKVFVYCKGNNIEIDAERVINEDLVGIISDLTISTELKEKIDNIIFSDVSIKDKRIAIKKLKSRGLSKVFIRMFMKLFEYIAEI